MSLASCWRAEGKDEAAKTATLHWARKAIRMMHTGKYEGLRRPPMVWNEDTNIFDYMRRVTKFVDGFTDQWKRIQVEKAVPTANAPSSVAGSSKDDVGGDIGTGKGTANKGKKRGPEENEGKGGKSSKKGKETADEILALEAQKLQAKAEAKELADLFKKAATSKTRYTTIWCSATDLETTVSTDKTWQYFNNDAALSDLKTASIIMGALKCGSIFSKSCLIFVEKISFI